MHKCLGLKKPYVLLALIWTGCAYGDWRQADAEMKLLLGARELSATYVRSLSLKGQTVSKAAQVMYSEGFRCGLENEGVAKSEPSFNCIKEGARLNEACSTVIVDIDPEWKAATRTELVTRMDGDIVKHATAFCPFDVRLAKQVYERYIDNHSVAEDQFRRSISYAHLVGKSLAYGFDQLLGDGFECGFDELHSDSAHPSAVAMCVRQPSRIEYCYQESVRFKVRWKKKSGILKEFVSQVKGVPIVNVILGCDLPHSAQAET